MTKAATRTNRLVATARRSKPDRSKSTGRVTLSLVMRYENPGQLTVPNQLSLGEDGKLYLSRSGEDQVPTAKLQAISVKESVAWFRLGHDCNMNLTKGEKFSDWLKSIEHALS